MQTTNRSLRTVEDGVFRAGAIVEWADVPGTKGVMTVEAMASLMSTP